MAQENMNEWRMNSLGFMIAVLASKMADELDISLKALDLRITFWPTLMMLWDEDGLTQTELSERCQTAHYTTTRMLDALEKKGLIERKPHPSSRRAHLVYLTDSGKALKQEGLTRAAAINADFLSALDEQEKQIFMILLNKLVEKRP